MAEPLQPGARIGILGGGQLGRMLVMAAARLGFVCHIYEPEDRPPAAQVAARLTTASYTDTDALMAFARAVDVITYEFENIPVSALDQLQKITPVRPGIDALTVSQDRLSEKEFLNNLGLATTAFAAVQGPDALRRAVTRIGTPSILKTRRFGYDGKGQIAIRSRADTASAAQKMADTPAILEAFVDFSHEVSVIGARNPDGQIACYDPGQNVHKSGVLHSTTLPAELTATQRTDAILMTAKILNALDYVGVLGVEFFVTPDGLIINEIAPRVHNSGHWTQNGCAIDQFEQHIRAIAGWPLGDATRLVDIQMINLIGHDIDR
ncbi:MAG: 5-(carboxyamino)imidazole ribonucleotide synthase, partial [Paracoccaceae bacterium]